VAEKDPDAIYNMMKDNGDSITVRMFSEKENGDLEPKFYTFPKSTRTGDAHAYDSEMWVQMLEKAYSIHVGTSYKDMEGGDASVVLKHLLGQKSEKVTLGMENVGVLRLHDVARQLPTYTLTDKSLNVLTQKYNLNPQQVDQLKKASDGELASIKVSIRSFWKWDMKNDRQKLDAFAKDVLEMTDNRPRQKALVKILEHSKTAQSMKGKIVNLQSDVNKVIAELKTYALSNPTVTNEDKTFDSNTLIDIFETVVTARKSAFKKTDSYDKEQIKVFNQIQKALKDGKYLAVGSRKDIGTPQGTGHSGGESKVDGLASGHAYGLLDAVDIGGKKFVRIANPWGNEFARSYELKDGQLVMKEFDEKDVSYLPNSENKKGGGIPINESWVELNDFFFTFGSLHLTK